MTSGATQRWRERLFSAVVVLATAAAGGAASYVATWNIEAQKARFEASKKVQEDFQTELSKALILVRQMSEAVVRTKKVDEKQRGEAVASLLGMQILFHPESGRWPSAHKRKAKEVMEALARYQSAIDTASKASDIDKANELLYAVFPKKDSLFADIRKDTELRISRIIIPAEN